MTALAVAMLLAHAAPGRAAPLDDILAKNLAARGGEAKLREIKTLRLTGRFVFGGGTFSVEAAWGQVQKRGAAGAQAGEMRSELTLQGLTQINAYGPARRRTVRPIENS